MSERDHPDPQPSHAREDGKAEVVRVVGAAIVRDSRCLATQRSAEMSLPLKWEFPGGKVEPGEAPTEALIREIEEELGLEIRVGSYLGTGSSIAGSKCIVLDVYVADCVQGDLRLAEHSDFGWFTAEELRRLDWAEADIPLLPVLYRLLEGERGS